jgi:WD40 repeat protein
MAAEPPDRTATLVPHEASAARGPADDVGDLTQLEVDDPERYEQIGEHARGGLGRIVRAIDRRLGRTVAVKELLRHDEAHEERFVREALITARLEHPGIVPVHEAGRWPNGAPYYVMKLVEGRTLKALLSATQGLRARLGLLSHVIAVADAVGYAHSEGVVHRDLKPSNVIVGEFGETIVVDWGLALDQAEGAVTVARVPIGVDPGLTGKVVGTPAYMAPEQARGEAVDARADVYAIGAMLYELLAGNAPHADTTPQATLERVIAGPPPPLTKAAPEAPRELVDIVRKAMARPTSERYANATALAEDLRRFQTGKLVRAHAYTRWQRVRKRLAQHRGVIAIATASTIALAVVGIESLHTVVAERDIAFAARASAEDRERELVLVQAKTSLRKDPTAALAWLKHRPIGERDVPEAVEIVDEAVALGVARHVFRTGGWVSDVEVSADSQTVVVAGHDSMLRAYDVRSGAGREVGHAPSPLEAIAIACDGQTVVTGGMFGEVIAWSLAGAQPRTLVTGGHAVTGLQFDVGCGRVLVHREWGPDEVVTLGGERERIGDDAVMRVAVARGDWSRRVALVAPNEVVALGGAAPRVVVHTDRAITSVAMSPTGDAVIVHDGHALWSAPFTGGPMTKLLDYPGKLMALEWSPDCGQLVVLGHSADVPVIDLATHDVRLLRGHTDALYEAHFTRDGHALLTASDDGTARLWDLGDGSSRVFRGHDDDVYRARFSPDEQFVVTASLDGSARVWPLARASERVYGEGAPIDELAVTGDRALVHTASSLARWDLSSGQRESLFAWASDPRAMASGMPSPDGASLLVQVDPRMFEVRRRGEPAVVLRGHAGRVNHAEWSHDSKYVYTASEDGTLRRWDSASGASGIVFSGPDPVYRIAVAADGRVAANVGDRAVVVGRDGAVEELGSSRPACAIYMRFEPVRDRLVVRSCDHRLAIRTGEREVELETDGFELQRFAVSPDGTRIAGAMADRTVRVWDVDTGRLQRILRGHGDLVMDVAFSPDGGRLASASYDRTVRVWDLATSRSRVLRGHDASVNRVAWHGDRELVTGSEDGTMRVWRAPDLGLPTPAQLTGGLEAATTAHIDQSNLATSSRAQM